MKNTSFLNKKFSKILQKLKIEFQSEKSAEKNFFSSALKFSEILKQAKTLKKLIFN